MCRIFTNILISFALCISIVFPTCPAIAADDEPLIFSVTGDGPYGVEDWDLIPKYFEIEKQDGKSEFLIHVGDLNPGSMNPTTEYYEKVAALYKTSPIPIIFVIGDNEWNDHADPDFAWATWNRLFKPFPNHFADSPSIIRQEKRSENMVWQSKHVLFIGLNIVGGYVHNSEEWKSRHQQNVRWMRKNLRMFNDRVQSAVVFAHAAPNEKHSDFFDAFVTEAKQFDKPVLYIHGDGHRWQHEPNWRAKNILRVQVDQITKAPFVQITVNQDSTMPFHFNRRMD